jgi:hypothetical protein
MPPQQIQRFLDVGYGCEYFGAHVFIFVGVQGGFDDAIGIKNQGLLNDIVGQSPLPQSLFRGIIHHKPQISGCFYLFAGEQRGAGYSFKSGFGDFKIDGFIVFLSRTIVPLLTK